MVCCSLVHAGEELLGLRGGLEAYTERGSTMGIPLLHPWANRLAGPVAASPLLHTDANGMPIHGVLPTALPFAIEHETASSLDAVFATDDHPDVLEVFPYPHRLRRAGVAHRRRARDPNDAPRARPPAGPGRLRLPPVPAAAGRVAIGRRDRGARADAAPARRARDPHRRARPGRDLAGPARRARVRRRLRGRRGRQRVRRARGGPHGLGDVPRGLPLRPGLLPGRERVHRLRADDRADQRAHLRRLAHAASARRRLQRGVPDQRRRERHRSRSRTAKNTASENVG